MKRLYRFATTLLLLLPIALSAQPHSALGFSTEAGLGITSYTDNLVLEGEGERSFVWSIGAQGSYWWDFSPRLSIAAGLGVRLNYYHLQSSQRFDALMPLIGFELTGEEDWFRLKRAEHAITSAAGRVWGEYTLSRGRAHTFRLTGGMAVQRPFVNNVNTVYKEPTTAFEALFSFGSAGTFDRTASEPTINDYFRERLPDWQVNLQGGVVLYFFGRKDPQPQFYFSILYEHGLNPVSTGLSRPIRGLRGGLGVKFAR